jgi:Na+/proline symporter
VIFSVLGGLRAVLFTDCLLFIIAMVGAVAAAVVALEQPEVGGLTGMLSSDQLTGKLSILPALENADGSSNFDTVLIVLILPLAVQWWSVWYPGAEPGGGGYLAQRMLSAKNEKHAMGATLFFNAAHYAVRPWPWIIVALCSMIVFPLDTTTDREAAKDALGAEQLKPLVEQWESDPLELDEQTRQRIEVLKIQEKGLTSIKKAYPDTEFGKLGHDLAYPAMLTFLPIGLLGLVVASLIAAYMSTISTHLNWGSSYIVNDFWKRFVNKAASERELVWIGRISTVMLMVLAGVFALWLENALQAFEILLQIGAGTGLLFILRWFWWRINAFSELTAMVVSFVIAVFFEMYGTEFFAFFGGAEISSSEQTAIKLVTGVGITTAAWVLVTIMTKPAGEEKLRSFCRLAQPGGPGWKAVMERAAAEGDPISPEGTGWHVPVGIACMVAGCFAVYSTLFATGYWIYSKTVPAIILSVVAVISVAFLVRTWGRVTAR